MKYHCKSQDSLYDLAANMVATQIYHTLTSGKRASLMCSGGSTPGPLYKRLATEDFPWEQLDIGLVDERWVNADDAASNAALVKKCFATAEKINFTPLKTRHATPLEGQAEAEAAYQNIKRPFSVAILGMGLDGHVASWFPKAEGLEIALNSENLVQAITAQQTAITGIHTQRMTLTLHAIKSCELVILLIKGRPKIELVNKVFSGQNADLPVAHLIKNIPCIQILSCD